MKRMLVVVAVVVGSLFVFLVPAGAGQLGSVARSSTPDITCSVHPGHYCARIYYTSVSGGIRVTETKSTGYTRGPGKGREWFRYSCNGGTCYIVPSAVFSYGGADVQLNVTRHLKEFLPCGNVFGVQYRDPAKNAPGPGAVLFRVTCGGPNHTLERL
jgi:hypothetical protein